jgi:hypothetical protein
MRRSFLLGLLALTAATPAASQSRDLAIALSRTVADGRPALAMTVRNVSAREICLNAELMGNPYTGEIAPIGMRDPRGRPIPLSPDLGGTPPIPIPGVVRIAPGAQARAFYYIGRRFAWPRGSNTPLPRGLSARVSIHYGHCGDDPRCDTGYCDEAISLRSTSGWQPI